LLQELMSFNWLFTDMARVPYTMTKFVVYEKVSEAIYRTVDKATVSGPTATAINLGSGLIAGFAAAIVSQPADTMLSKINKTKGAPGEGTVSRLIKIAGELGLRGSFAGIGARLFMVGTLVSLIHCVLHWNFTDYH
jgi:solute carrier family 25 phosphate transporter 3